MLLITEESVVYVLLKMLHQRLHVDAQKVYVALTEQTDILQEYIIQEYEALHTQGKDYIADDIIDTMRESDAKL